MGMRREKRYTFSLSLLWAVCVCLTVSGLFFCFPLKNLQKKIFITRSIFFSTWQFLFVNFLWSRLLGRPTGNHDQPQERVETNTNSRDPLIIISSKTGKKKKKDGPMWFDAAQGYFIFLFPKRVFLIFIIHHHTVPGHVSQHFLCCYPAEIIIIFQNKSSPASVVI